MVQMFLLINILNCLPLIFVLKHTCTRLTILISSKNNHKIKVAETLLWPVGSQHSPLGLQIYYFIISENADRIDYLYGERGGGGGEGRGRNVEKEGVTVKQANYYYQYNLFGVSLLHLDKTFHVYACTRSVFFFLNKIYKQVCNIFKMVIKKIPFITKCNKKNCLKHITLQKKLSAGTKHGNPPIKNNGSSLKSRQVCRVGPDPVIMTLQIPNYTVCLNLFDNDLTHAFYPTFDSNLFI